MDIVEKRLDLPINSAGKYTLHHWARAGCRNELCRGETYLRYVIAYQEENYDRWHERNRKKVINAELIGKSNLFSTISIYFVSPALILLRDVWHYIMQHYMKLWGIILIDYLFPVLYNSNTFPSFPLSSIFIVSLLHSDIQNFQIYYIVLLYSLIYFIHFILFYFIFFYFYFYFYFRRFWFL